VSDDGRAHRARDAGTGGHGSEDDPFAADSHAADLSAGDLHADDRHAADLHLGDQHADDRFADDLYDETTLAAIDGWAPPPEPTPGPGISGWRRTSASGAVLGAALLGLGDALEARQPRDRPPIVMDDPGQPYDPDALVDVDFAEGSPAATTARLRPPGGRPDGDGETRAVL